MMRIKLIIYCGWCCCCCVHYPGYQLDRLLLLLPLLSLNSYLELPLPPPPPTPQPSTTSTPFSPHTKIRFTFFLCRPEAPLHICKFFFIIVCIFAKIVNIFFFTAWLQWLVSSLYSSQLRKSTVIDLQKMYCCFFSGIGKLSMFNTVDSPMLLMPLSDYTNNV